jgi:hypothetical protein
MKPNVELHIEELVLHGFNSGDRHRIGEAVERELVRLVSKQGFPDGFSGDVHIPTLDGGRFTMKHGAGTESVGTDIARSVFGVMGRSGSDAQNSNR